MMKHLFILFLLAVTTIQSTAQIRLVKNNEEPKWGIQFKGFVKSDYWYDSRQVYASREDLFLFYPKNIVRDKNGKDINAQDGVNFCAITTRLTGMISGPDAFGAKTSGVIEADFSGVTNADIDGFRLRHAYSKLKWEKYELLFGQYWHPMFVPEVFPQVVSLNTGAPFHPFIRNPQVSLTHFVKNGIFKNWNVSFALIGQRDNSNDGPDGFNNIYIRNAVVPNAHLQFQHKGVKNVIGFAADYKWLKPRLTSDSLYVSPEKIGSYAAMVYWKYTHEKFSWRFKTIYGQNLTEHLMLGGYAIQHRDSLTGIETYTPTNHIFVSGSFLTGSKIQFGLFGGYAKNFGTTKTNTGKYYARGSDVAYLYRISPSISFKSGSTQLSTEFEYTAAGYGTAGENGVVKNIQEVGNLRILFTVFYFF